MEKSKTRAALRIVQGTGQVVSGAMTASGKGLVGGLLKSQHMMGNAAVIGTQSMKSGSKKIKEGIKEWKECSG